MTKYSLILLMMDMELTKYEWNINNKNEEI